MLRQTPEDGFHDGVLDALRSPFAAATQGASSPVSWRRAALRGFLTVYFPAYHAPASFAALWRLLTPQPSSTTTATNLDAAHADTEGDDDAEDAALTLSFEALRGALKRHASARLLARDPFPLEHEQLLDATRTRRSEEELELPALQPALSKRSSLPVLATPTAATSTATTTPPSRQSVAVVGSRILLLRDVDASSSSSSSSAATPLLLDFRSEVLKKSRNWLGRWHTRYLFLRWNELEICKKNVSAAASASGGAPTAAAVSAAKSKRYPLHTLLSLQLVQLSESDPSKKQALSLHFKQPTANGGNTTKSLTLGCDSSAQLKTVVIQIATFALLHGLATGQDAASLHKFIQVGANLDVYCLVPRPNMPPFALSPLQLAFLQSDERSAPAFEATIQLLVRAGADARSVLQWQFATHVLFSSAYGPDSEMLARRLLMVRESIVGVVFPFGGVVADDEYQWTLLMYFSCYGELEAARQLLVTFLKISKSKCLKYVDHVNAAGDNALHIAIKSARRHARAEELAMLLVDVGTNSASFVAADSSAADVVPSAAPSLAPSVSSIDSQLIHCSDGSGESVFHLALKARLWRLVDKLIDCKAIDPTSTDRHGNNSLHVAIKVGAPVHLVARVVQLYRPQRLSAFSSMSTERSNLVTTLGYDCRDRRGNDTPLTLAIKHRREDVVELLLAAGASPNTGECAWAIDVALPDTPAAVILGKIGDGDAPLHVAIKSGLPHAAMSLVAHGANLLAVDSNGASPLALAIRFGMYALGGQIATKMASKEGALSAASGSGAAREREQKQWMDLESGAPVCLLAVKAGQIELVAMLLDLSDSQMHLSHHVTKETLLHLLVKNVCWLEFSGAARDGDADAQQQQLEDDESSRQQFYSDMLSPTKRKRNRLKSRSEGDLRHLRMSLLAAATPPKLKKAPSTESAAAAAELSSSHEVLRKIAFFQDAEVALLRGILQRSSDVTVVSAASKSQQQALSAWSSSFHLATVPSLVVTDHNIDSYTPLHVAAAGGEATSSALSLFLAFLFLRSSSSSRLEVAQALAKTTGASCETPLHAALASNSPANALQILFAARVVSGKQSFASVDPSEKDASGGAVDPDAAKQLKALCSRIYEAETVPSGSTPLHLACLWPLNADMLHVMELLLEDDAYAGNWDADGLAPLHVALQNHCDERLIQLFQRYHQDLNAWTEGLAAKRGSGSSRQLSGNDTSDSDVGSSGPKTALMVAIEHENVGAFRELVRHGAQLRVVTPKTRLGLLHFAVQCKVRSRELLQSLLSCSKLVEHEVTDWCGRTTAYVVQSLEEQLDEQLRLSSDGGIGSFVTRRTSAVPEEPDDDDTSGSQQLNRVQEAPAVATTASVGNQVEANAVVSEAVAPPSSTPLAPSQSISISYAPPPSSSDDHRVQTSTTPGAVVPDTRQQQFVGSSLAATASARPAVDSRASSAGGGSPSRAPHHATARYLQGLPHAPSLDSAAIEYLREEERATLTLVAHEARQEAKDWLKKRIGQKKLLSDARAQLQSFQKHRRTGSGPVPVPTRLQDGDGPMFNQENERQLEQYKALAAKKFIDKHVAEAVAEARMEIEREKQAIFQDTGLYPGRTTSKFPSGGAPHHRRGEMLHRTASNTSSSMLGASSRTHRSESNATLLSDESVASVWWSERGGTSFDDLTGTWLSTAGGGRGGTMLSESWNGTWLSSMRGTGIEYRDSRLSSTFHSFLEAENNDPYGADGTPGVAYAAANTSRKDGDDDREEDEEDWDDEYMNPLDRDSFSHVIETRNSLS